MSHSGERRNAPYFAGEVATQIRQTPHAQRWPIAEFVSPSAQDPSPCLDQDRVGYPYGECRGYDPAQLQVKLGAKNDGTFTALKAVVHMDTGAYASYGPAVGIILTETLSGSYRIPNVDINTFIAYTNSPLSGAMRGFGSPQSHFAIESMVDILADALHLDSVEIRKKNILKPGDLMFTGVEMNDSARSLPICLEKAEGILNKYRSIEPQAGKQAGISIHFSTT